MAAQGFSMICIINIVTRVVSLNSKIKEIKEKLYIKIEVGLLP